jgi:hypothetical protein
MCSSPIGPPAAAGEVAERHDEACPRQHPEEDDVTDPGTSDVTDADRAEQEALLDPPEISLATDAVPPAPDVPEADALDQQLVARPRGTGGPLRPVGDREANEADVLEQEEDVPVEDDDPL